MTLSLPPSSLPTLPTTEIQKAAERERSATVRANIVQQIIKEWRLAKDEPVLSVAQLAEMGKVWAKDFKYHRIPNNRLYEAYQFTKSSHIYGKISSDNIIAAYIEMTEAGMGANTAPNLFKQPDACQLCNGYGYFRAPYMAESSEPVKCGQQHDPTQLRPWPSDAEWRAKDAEVNRKFIRELQTYHTPMDKLLDFASKLTMPEDFVLCEHPECILALDTCREAK